MVIATAALALVTYARLPAGSTYGFAGSGLSGGASRAATYLAFPGAIIGIACVAAAGRGRLAWLAVALCTTTAIPGALDQHDNAVRWVNAPAIVGTALALAVTIGAEHSPLRLGPGRRVALALLGIWSIPWLVAATGAYADTLPLLRALVNASAPTPGDPGLPAVHLGLHDGLFGAQLAAGGILLSARTLRPAASLVLALCTTYGIALAAADGWHEQVVKRGWVDVQLPDVLQPALTPAWAAVILAAALLHRRWRRRPLHEAEPPHGLLSDSR